MLPVAATDEMLKVLPPIADIDAKLPRIVVWDPPALLISCICKYQQHAVFSSKCVATKVFCYAHEQ
jgi:hypothetical protein